MTCIVCGKKFDGKIYYGEYSDCCCSKCFTKKFWNDIVTEKDEHIIVDGTCYAIPHDAVNWFHGFGGRRFKIKMLDTGDVIETNNLWCQGKVPEEYRHLLPNTAQFV